MAEIKEVKKPPTQAEDGRSRGLIGCPYFDLDQSIKVAQAVHTKGGGTCTTDQLAEWLGYSTIRSGTFLTRISAAKQFGMIVSSGDKLNITERAKTILAPVMPDDAVSAKVDAFLAVPLFSKIFDQFYGAQLPPEIGLKNLFQGTFKIVNDRVAPSVRVFLNSAEQAGMLVGQADKQRLIKPSVSGVGVAHHGHTKEAPKEEKPQEKLRGSGEGPPGGIHTAIVGLLRELPQPGTSFSKVKKQRFLDAMKSTIDWVYPEEEDSQ